MEKYTLEFLSEEFERHMIKSEENKVTIIREYQKMNPAEELPEHIKNDFSLPKALKVIVDELRTVKNDLLLKEDNLMAHLGRYLESEENSCDKDVK